MAYVTKLIETYPGFGPSVVVDGSMETDPLGPTGNWKQSSPPNPTITIQTANVHGGCQSLQVQANNPLEGVYQDVTVVPGHRYRIGVWGLQGAPGMRWRMRISIPGGVSLWMSGWHNNATWEEEVKFYRVPDGVTTIRISLGVEAAADIIYFDDVTCCREAPVPMAEIDLMFRATDDWSLLQQGIRINDPRIVEIWGGELEDQLVRRSEGKRVIPMELNLEAVDADTLIEDVNELEEMLRHGAAYRTEGKRSGYGEVFVQFKTADATHSVWYPVLCGQINKTALMKMCGSDKMIDKVPVVIICEAYWESPYTYDLENLLDNPGFEEWNAGICDSQPDCWADYSDGPGTNNQETEIVAEGCEALRIEVDDIDINKYQGVRQVITTRVQEGTRYTLLGWVQNDTIVNGQVVILARGVANLCVALASGAANANYTQYSCQFTPAAADIVAGIEIRIFVEALADHCTGIARVDKMQVMESSQVPTGWMSSSYLTNHYDRDANEVNFLSVCDIPGEVEAEMRFDVEIADECEYLHIAKRTRNEPCKMQWQLLPCEAYTTAEGGAPPCTPALIDAACINSDKVADAFSPCTCRVVVNFGVQAMSLRAYWDITTNLPNYYGKWMLAILCDVTGTTDTIKMKIFAYQDIQNWGQGYIIEQTVPNAPANEWELLSGWQILSFPVGSHDDDLWDINNRWHIEVHASSTGTTDDLWIAGAYLIPLDDGYFIGGDPTFSGGVTMSIVDLDGERGVFPHYSNYYLSNVGGVGKYPSLTPEIENFFYFILSEWGDHVIANTMEVSLKYRPRGIFLRGTNP